MKELSSEIGRLQSDFRAAGDLYPSFTIHQKAGNFYTAGPPQANERFRSLAKFAVDALTKAGIDTGDQPHAEIRFMVWLFSGPATTTTGAWENAPVGPSNPEENHTIESAFYAAADAIGRLASEPLDDGPIAPGDPNQMVSPSTIAMRFKFTIKQRERLRKRLTKWRNPANCREWTEVADRGPKQPQYLYRLGSVQYLIDLVKTG